MLLAALRLLSKIQLVDGCWIFTGSQGGGRGEYGRMRVPAPIAEAMRCPGGRVQAHRLSVWLFVGPFDLDLVVDHACNNSLCVNPDHLNAITLNENAVDANDVRWSAIETLPGDEWA